MTKTTTAKVLSVQDIIDQLISGASDREIAQRLDCHPSVIAKLKRTVSSARPTIKAPIVKADRYRPNNSKEGPPTVDYKRFQHIRQLEDGSRALLIRQLETGQHALSKEKFIAIVNQIGLMHRLPKGIRA